MPVSALVALLFIDQVGHEAIKNIRLSVKKLDVVGRSRDPSQSGPWNLE